MALLSHHTSPFHFLGESVTLFGSIFYGFLVAETISVMKNVTITLDEKVASWARVRAAERETSVSRLVGEMLKETMLQEESYHALMQHYLSQSPHLLKEPGAKYPDRDELHER